MKYAITTRKAPAPFGHYSQGTTAGRLVFTAGQVGIDPATGVYHWFSEEGRDEKA